MMITQWFKTHATAILVTAVAVAKGGLLGKAASNFVLALAAILGGTIS